MFRRLVRIVRVSCLRHVAVLAALLGVSVGSRAALPSEAEVEIEGVEFVLDAFKEQAGLSVAQANAKVTTALPPDADTVWVTACVKLEQEDLLPSLTQLPDAPAETVGGGDSDPRLAATFRWRDGKDETVDAEVCGSNVLEDWYFQLPWSLKYHIRPDMSLYDERRQAEVKTKWSHLPSAAAHFLTIELRRAASGAQMWIDGRYVRTLPRSGPLRELVLRVPRGGAVKEIAWSRSSGDTDRFLPLTIGRMVRVDKMADAVVSLGPSTTTVEGVPMQVAPGGSGLAVAGLGRVACGVSDLTSFYWNRSAFDGMQEARIISVPQDCYAAAHVLCAAEEDPAKTPAFTSRLTRYANSRGGAMADTVVQLPGQSMKQVGTVSHGPAAARRTVPLWLVRVPLKTGRIQDLLHEDETKYGFRTRFPESPYLDLEIMDPVPGVDDEDAFPPDMSPTGRRYTPYGKQSSAHIFGLTLEKSPADLTVRTSQRVSIFYRAENPELRARVDAKTAGVYSVAWDIADIDGRIVASGARDLALNEAGSSQTVAVPLTVGNGWYAVSFRLRDAHGRELIDNRSTFAVLPPDTREAGFESPHGAWWFHWAHGGAPDIARVGPVYRRAGLRHAILPKSLPEIVTSEHKLTAWCVPWNGRLLTDGTLPEMVARYETHIRETLESWPSLNTVMINHESSSYNAPAPSELWGKTPPPLPGEDNANWQHRMEVVTALVAMVRGKYPNMKIQFGNCGNSCPIVAEYFRRGLPPESCDYVAVEDLGQTFIPERPLPGAMQSAWLLRETARVMGRPNAQITATYEWLGRRDAGLGRGPQAEWYVRDALQARAYGFHAIPLGTIHDAGQGYFHTIWGSGGLCGRYPYMYPKPAYAALATLTRVLDCARFERAIPQASLSLYVLEFRRGDDWVYALWTPRGRRKAELTFAENASLTVTDLYGRERSERVRTLAIEVGTAAQYVASRTRLADVVAGKAWFPDDVSPEEPFIADALDDTARLEFIAEPDKRLERAEGWHLPHRTRGHFEMRPVQDEEKGRCIEIELKPDGPVSWDLMHEYAILKLREPVAAPEGCTSVGVWIKGNSGWGDVMWEVRNDKGETWLTTGVWWDWRGMLAVNFDGWNFLQFELAPRWQNGLTVTGLAITMPRRMLYATEMVTVPELTVRLRDLCCFR